MALRISRAKQNIKNSGIAFHLPTNEERAERLRAVLHVLHLIFNEGYTSSVGPDLCRADCPMRRCAWCRSSTSATGRHGSRWIPTAHVVDGCSELAHGRRHDDPPAARLVGAFPGTLDVGKRNSFNLDAELAAGGPRHDLSQGVSQDVVWRNAGGP